MTKIVAVAVVASLIAPAVSAQEAPVERCLKCSIRQVTETLQIKPSRVGSAGAVRQQSSRNGRGVGRSIAIGALIGAGGGAAIGGLAASSEEVCDESQGGCVAGMVGSMAAIGAGIGALVGWAVGR